MSRVAPGVSFTSAWSSPIRKRSEAVVHDEAIFDPGIPRRSRRCGSLVIGAGDDEVEAEVEVGEAFGSL